MNIDDILSSMLNGEPLHDGIVIGVVFVCFFTFYNVLFSSFFNIFKK